MYLGELGGQIHLITGGGKHIQGVGMQTGSPAKLQINTYLPKIGDYTTVPQGNYNIQINNVNFASTTIVRTAKGFEVNFNVNSYASDDIFEISIFKDDKQVGSIPLKVDVQKKTVYKKDKKKQRESTPIFGFVIIAIVLSFLIKWTVRFLLKEKSWLGLVFGLLGLFFGDPIFGLTFSIVAIHLSRSRKTRMYTIGLLVGILGIIVNIIRLKNI